MAHNLTYKVEKNKLIIEVDVSERARGAAPPSATAKTKLVASTAGALPVPNVAGMTFSLNVMAK